jgi:hypothetical protein
MQVRAHWRNPAAIVNYRPDLLPERVPHINETRNCLKIVLKRKIGHGSQMGA